MIDILKQEIEKEIPDKKLLFIIIENLMKIGDKRALPQLEIVCKTCDADIKELDEQAFDYIEQRNWNENIIHKSKIHS